MHVQREHDPGFINRIVNSASVRPFVDFTGQAGEIDVAPMVGYATQTGIVWLSNAEDAVTAFVQTADRFYEAHLFYGDTCRGRQALEFGRSCIAYLEPVADMIWGSLKPDHKSALWFARQLGFNRTAVDDNGAVIVTRVLH